MERLRGPVARPALALAGALALAAAAYARVASAEFQYDDLGTVERNPAIRDAGALALRLVPDLLAGGRPVTDLTFALSHAAGGLDPRVFHLANLAIHLAAVVLVWALTRTVLRLAGAARSGWTEVAVAGVFALHPLQSEAVSYVSQRAESLSSALYVGTLLLVLAAERRGLRWRAAPLWAAALAAFALALGAKAVAVTLPAAWLLLAAAVPSDDARAGLLGWRRRLLAVLPFAALDAAFAWRALAGVSASEDAGFSVPGLPPWTYALTQLRAIPVYLRLLVWPAGQNVDWDLPLARGLSEPAVWGSGLLLAALAAGAVALVRRSRRRRGEDAAAARVAGFGVLWFFLLLSPTSSVVPLADVLVEHRLYLASWGAIVAVAVAAERLLARGPSRWRAPAAAALVAATWGSLAAALHARNAVWETRRALWADAVAKSPQKARPRFELAHAALRDGDLDAAIRGFRDALRRSRGSARLEREILANLGAAQLLAGRPDDAEATLRFAVAGGRAGAAVLTNLAVALLAQGRDVEAEPYAARAAALEPQEAGAWSVVGELALRRGDAAGALSAFERAAALEPFAGARRFQVGRALAAQGRVREACEAWGRIDPAGDGELRAALAAVRAERGCDGPR